MDDLDELSSDSVLGPIVRDIRATRAELNEAKARLREQGDRIKNHEDTWIKSGYESQLHGIAAHHRGRYKKDLDRNRFIGFAVERGVTDLGVAYRAFSLDDERELVTREAEERGERRGRAEGGYGAPRIRPPHLGDVGSLQELTDERVLADPDIQRALRGEE